MHIKHLIILVALVLAPISAASPAHAGGVVTVCDEAHLLAALAGGGMVTFACSGTIVLTNTITIDADTTIDGSGQDVIIEADYGMRVFTVNSEAALTLHALTVADGNLAEELGGGIFNNGGIVTVSDCTFSSNSAAFSVGGAIYNGYGGTLTVDKSIFVGNSAVVGMGGGIFNNGGTVTVSNSTFMSNVSGGGGAISNARGTLTLSNCTFTGNRASGGGAAIYNSSHGTLIVANSTFTDNITNRGGGSIGAGIYNDDSGTVTVSNSTFTGNYASYGGGIGNMDGMVTVNNSTFSGNRAIFSGSGIFSHGSNSAFTVKNTIVANSVEGDNCMGAIADGGGNLSFPDTTCPGINADPLLGPLQDNGGPTWTMALGPGSAAIDAADNAICAADPVNNRDQRGVARPQGAHCDVGAFERPGKWLPIILVE